MFKPWFGEKEISLVVGYGGMLIVRSDFTSSLGLNLCHIPDYSSLGLLSYSIAGRE